MRAGRFAAAGGGELAAADAGANDALRRAVALACRALQGQTVLLPQPGSDDPPLVGLVIPMAGPATISLATHGAECALLLVKDPSRAPLPGANLLQHVFGFTVAEAQLTEALSAGKSLEQIGDERGTTRGTLRVQLKSVMSKAGVRRQGELIALAHRTAAVDARGVHGR